MNFSLHQTQRLIQLMKCPVHGKTVTVIETGSEKVPLLKVSGICCEPFGLTITAVIKIHLHPDMPEKTNVQDIFTISLS